MPMERIHARQNEKMRLFLTVALLLLSFHPGIAKQCGESPVHPEDSGKTDEEGGHIVGGKEAAIGSWPWMVSLQFRDPWDGQYFHVCGATLIQPSYVITAAHCVDNRISGEGRDDPSNYLALLGAHNLYLANGQEQWVQVQDIIVHEDWLPDPSLGFPNDIAILSLSQAVDLDTERIDIACLPKISGVDFSGNECWISGWGLTEAGNPFPPDVLYEGLTPVLTPSACKEAGMPFPILSTHVCVGSKGAPIACQGDSGGPISCSYNGQWYVTGISSWTYDGCSGYPAVYTRVSEFSRWIAMQIKDDNV